MWGLSGRFSCDSTWVAHLRSYDMDVTLEVNFLEYVMTRQSCCSFVVTQQCFSNFNHVMIQALLWHDSVFQISIMSWYRLCSDTTVFPQFQSCHGTGFVVTWQCCWDFNYVMIQVCHDATVFFRFQPCHGYRSCSDTTVFPKFQSCHDTSLVVT